MKLDKPRLPVSYVDSSEKLAQVCKSLSSVERIGLDAERASGFKYSQSAYLIQIATSDHIYLIDPVPLAAADPAWSEGLAKAMKPITWLLHAATQDLPCLAELGIRPSKLIDTELAARLAGLERVGLGSIALELADIELAKEHSAADWSLRPLSPEMLDYAALDVDVMFDIWDELETRLATDGKLDWALEEFAHLVNFTPKAPLAEPWRGLPGLSKVKDLAKVKIAAALWLARDEVARDRDVAPGRLIPDRSIMAAVEQPPKSKSDLASNKAFQGRASRSMLNEWWDAIQQSSNLDIELSPKEKGNGIPSHRSWEKRFPLAHRRLEIIRPKLLEVASGLSVPIENLLTPDYLRRVCFEPGEDVGGQLRALGARDWQIDLVLETITTGLELAATQPEA